MQRFLTIKVAPANSDDIGSDRAEIGSAIIRHDISSDFKRNEDSHDLHEESNSIDNSTPSKCEPLD